MEEAHPYKKIWLSDFFHSFPHLNRHMKKVESNFKPDESEYRESLSIWALIPVAFCCVLWLFYFVYFICRCCEKPIKPKKAPSVFPRVTTGLFIFFGVGLLSFGLYENEEAHRGVDIFRENLIDINRTVGSATERIDSLDYIADDVSGRLSTSIIKAVTGFHNTTVENHVDTLVKKIQKEATLAKQRIDKVDLTDEFDYLDDAIKISDDVEYYRWLVTVVVHCLFFFVLFLTLISLLLRSRALLIVSTTVCILCTFFLWTTAGGHLGSSVGLGDLCIDPNAYVLDLADTKDEKAVLKAYVECVNNSSPYGDEIQGAIKSLTQAQIVLDSMNKFLKPFEIKAVEEPITEMTVDLKFAMANLSILLDDVGLCTTLHSYYEEALDGACVDTIAATALLSLTCCVVGLCCFVIIISNSVLWRQYVKKRQAINYGQVDDTDPFLPRPPPYDSDYGAVGYSSPTPWSERGTLQRHQNESPYSDESLMMLPHTQRHSAPLPVDESPPPAYHPGRFVRQYAASDNR